MTATRSAAALLLAGALVLGGCNRGEEAAPASTALPDNPPDVAPSALAAGDVVLDSPVDEADVKQCEIFRGRASLPADKTIVLGVRNKDNGSSERYFSSVTDWEYPKDLGTWTGMQWFGDKDTSVDQSFRVEVLIVDLTLVQEMHEKAVKDGWHSPKNPAGAEVAAHIDLHRKKGPGPAACS